jgi:hypothetical protein
MAIYRYKILYTASKLSEIDNIKTTQSISRVVNNDIYWL